MAELKTSVTQLSPESFLKGIKDEKKRKDSLQLLQIMKKATGAEPRMWGASIVGFGEYHYVYESGREGDWFLTGFSPRARSLTLYLVGGFDHAILQRLGKHKTGKGCVYINTLEDVDVKVLTELITASVKQLKVAAR